MILILTMILTAFGTQSVMQLVTIQNWCAFTLSRPRAVVLLQTRSRRAAMVTL